MSYDKLQQHFKKRTPYKYDKFTHFDGEKIISTITEWVHTTNGWHKTGSDKVVLAEYVSHKGREYAVVYNRGNKCFTTEVMAWGFNSTWRRQNLKLKYGEIGKPDKDQQKGYRCQMIDSMIYAGAVQYLLIPTTLEGNSDFFKLI